MKLTDIDYWWQELILDCPKAGDETVAHIKVRQPQGYTQEIRTADVEVRDGQVHVRIVYPLVDEGRCDAAHGNWNGLWEMGEYQTV